ncbi:MAG: hypothetical protein Q9169_005526 [Polycauliona sp. 2 TL-2023]
MMRTCFSRVTELDVTENDDRPPGGKSVLRVAEKAIAKRDLPVVSREHVKASFWNPNEQLDEDFSFSYLPMAPESENPLGAYHQVMTGNCTLD